MKINDMAYCDYADRVTMPRGSVYRVGNHLVGCCKDCGKVKRIDGILGGLHLCNVPKSGGRG